MKIKNIVERVLNPLIDLFCLKNEKHSSYGSKEKARFYLERKIAIQRLERDAL